MCKHEGNMANIRYHTALPYFQPEEVEPVLAQFRAIVQGDAMLSMGPQVQQFEQAFADYCGTKYAVATNACSAALEISLRMIGLQPGDEVIVPAETFIATAASV